MATEDRKARIFLVYSAEQQGASDATPIESNREQGIQLELFPSEKTNALIFTTLDRKDFPRIQELIAHCDARFILDLRELPSLAFERMTREKFFLYLASRGIEYSHFQKLVHGAYQEETISRALEHLGDEQVSELTVRLRAQLKRFLDNGPTVVFTDGPPERDDAARSLADSLVKSNLHFSRVIVADKPTPCMGV